MKVYVQLYVRMALAPRTSTPRTAVHRIADALCEQIVDGTLPPHSRVPPVRALAERFDVNIATIQRVLARLEVLELIEVRHGSGATVRELSRSAGIELMPITLASERDPKRAGQLLADFLELRRVVAVQVVLRRVAGRRRFDVRELEAALARLRETIALDPADHRAISSDEVQVSRTLILAVDHTAAVYVLNVLERLMSSNDDLLQACYQDAAEGADFWEQLVQLVARPASLGQHLDTLDAAMRAIDERTVRRFVKLHRTRKERM